MLMHGKPCSNHIQKKCLDVFSGESEIRVASLGAASQSKLVPGLKPYTWYSFQVQGATMEGDAILWGNWSETVEIRTQQAGIEIKSL